MQQLLLAVDRLLALSLHTLLGLTVGQGLGQFSQCAGPYAGQFAGGLVPGPNTTPFGNMREVVSWLMGNYAGQRLDPASK